MGPQGGIALPECYFQILLLVFKFVYARSSFALQRSKLSVFKYRIFSKREFLFTLMKLKGSIISTRNKLVMKNFVLENLYGEPITIGPNFKYLH